MQIDEIKTKLANALKSFYEENPNLLANKLCERCIAHRIAIHLENQDFDGYFVDCEYNITHIKESPQPKVVSNLNGNYIDIIISKRDGNVFNDLVCFEVKRAKNYNGRKKDRENLKILTGGNKFNYTCGFYLIIDKDKLKTKIEFYEQGKIQVIYRIDSNFKFSERKNFK